MTVGVVEHLLAALAAAGISDAEIEVDGEEIPILDGSAAPWSAAIGAVGRIEGPPIDPWRVERSFSYDEGDSSVVLRPAAAFALAVEVDFGVAEGPRGRFQFSGGEQDFQLEVAPARTFALARDVERLVAVGRGRGADRSNTVVYGDPSDPSPLRFADEGVRHKLLDALGDLALLERPLRGEVTVIRGSHGLHVRALRAWCASWTAEGR